MSGMHILPWVLSALTIFTMYLAGSKNPGTWTIGLINQGLWLAWILGTENYGFLPMNIALWIVYWRNHRKWRADRESGP